MYKFVVAGQPLSLRKFKPGERREFDDHIFDRAHFAINIANQFGERPPLQGPLSVKILFYFRIPRGTRERQQNLIEQHYCSKPTLTKLIDFIQESLQGIVYESKHNIVSVYSIKLYDMQPRTELFIGELNAQKNQQL